MTELAYPYRFDENTGRTATTAEERHVRDLIEQVLFTNPGERVNRPNFGCGLLRLIFAPNSDVLAAATQLTVQGQLQQWLSERIRVDAVDVQNLDATLQVTVKFVVLETQQQATATFERAVG
jgi:phage baseplate assembly protein W